MARGRMLNKKVSKNLQFNELPDDTCRLLATWTIAHLDVNGVFHSDPVMVRSIVFIRRPDITDQQIESYLQAMEKVGLIVRYEANGESWQYWPAFAENQVGLRADRETPEYPPPPDGAPPDVQPTEGESIETVPQESGKRAATIPQDSGENPAEVKLSEGLSELKGSHGASAPCPTHLDAWLKLIEDEKNKPAVLLRMHEVLYPGRSPPDYGFIGKTAKTVGGYGYLGKLLWQAQAYKVTGDVLRYCMAMAKGGKDKSIGMAAAGDAIDEWAERFDDDS